MNKKKKTANKKHYKTRIRLKALNDLSLKKIIKKPAKKVVAANENVLDDSNSKKAKDTSAKKSVAKKAAVKKASPKKKTTAKKK